ncbi:hypothetical protein HanIR_Chr15g0736901 [Helianthus annuus]|nr:hypothetical protein HanIR_Chr15g0736901 [Helianthus annuus]
MVQLVVVAVVLLQDGFQHQPFRFLQKTLMSSTSNITFYSSITLLSSLAFQRTTKKKKKNWRVLLGHIAIVAVNQGLLELSFGDSGAGQRV